MNGVKLASEETVQMKSGDSKDDLKASVSATKSIHLPYVGVKSQNTSKLKQIKQKTIYRRRV